MCSTCEINKSLENVINQKWKMEQTSKQLCHQTYIKQAGAELGQALLNLGLDFTIIFTIKI